jgi:hypothetical protein
MFERLQTVSFFGIEDYTNDNSAPRCREATLCGGNVAANALAYGLAPQLKGGGVAKAG